MKHHSCSLARFLLSDGSSRWSSILVAWRRVLQQYQQIYFASFQYDPDWFTDFLIKIASFAKKPLLGITHREQNCTIYTTHSPHNTKESCNTHDHHMESGATGVQQE